MTVLPDVLAPGLDVIFCGSAVGDASAKAGAYYAGPGNRFWKTLAAIGLTEDELRPRDYPLVLTYGIGLTDMNKTDSGSDASLSQEADEPGTLRATLEKYQPAYLAFNGKRAAEVFFGAKVAYGRQPEPVGATVVHVLPSTPGAARGFWDVRHWQALMDDITAHRLTRSGDEALYAMTADVKENFRVSLNRRVFHRIGLDLRKKRDESEFASRMTSPVEITRQKRIVHGCARDFFARNEELVPQAEPGALEALVDEFFEVYERRAVRDNEGGTKFADSFWLFAVTRLLGPNLIIESGTHRGHSSWLMRQACPDAEIHCFDVSFRNLLSRDPAIHYHEHDWMEHDWPEHDSTVEPLANAGPARALCYFDDHISHAQRVREAHARGFRMLLFDDDFPAHHLHATGHPPAPTLAMMFDDALEDGERIEWLRHGKPREFVFDAADAGRARALIAHYAKTPDLGPLLRVRPQSGLGIVKLVD